MIDHFRRLSTVSRRQKIALQLVVDSGLIVACFLAAMTIRLESLEFLSNLKIWLPVSIAAVAAIGTFWLTGLYRTLVRFVTGKILTSIAKGILAFAIILFVASNLLTAGIPRSVPIISGVLLFLAIGGIRFVVRQIFRKPMQVSKRPVVIYGAGEAGLELVNSLFHGRDYAPIAFVDDDPRLQKLTISGIPVYSPQAIPRLADGGALEVVLLAMPNLSHSRRREIFASLEDLDLEVKTIPGLSDIISGRAEISELRNVTAEDLLGRDPVAPDAELLKRNIANKVVMVSGAGGSIGSELCRQILGQGPRQLILYEISEFALYTIEQELSEMADQIASSAKIIPVLGSVQNAKRLEAAIKAFKVETIYHAAAYKHVPLVEENVVEGIRNNVFGTLTIARLALQNNVANFILISTDKAVRPTNVMGATKRIAELICQAFAKGGGSTNFSMVRFGNVLGSSGSVIPRFRSQIEAGGPLTVTHPDITRYFMTIPEASQLVIQAGAMARGGDVFVLDMGEPVRIADLAVTMVKLHGLTPYFVNDTHEVVQEKGDIPICFTGLRKGEKLFEELLIGNDPQATEHPRVLSAKEISMAPDKLLPLLDRLLEACKSFNLPEIHDILRDLPLEYSPLQDRLFDLVWEATQTLALAGQQVKPNPASQ
ncbi:polysaccharide biosynthesis protein [Qipengyuania nanhaisediminis]|uniref:NDP-sugar epimerase, includes UDP-GlcNAc-inverting 4,6-dehydratase FlaA1 and capsular polysaccharide biosynthesis protein EpsC n=1 Tax=Qipengyuania nanhaisediminis TaxID=604088 RepID=A0A1I5QEC8_9SPHN|nr:nucleoside-diphosphate sugar epimerase/dehydratase [Qipengyuania nanhaisediminis]SFP44477.1 NDP-sugar epimerase, includes UDP-GlcNAc-inverting 4,6-dehydratase FlaA1 and capsular polysaccharide biosynthesis protein EpsC [Qipengyuania nanhaisediminis]